MTEKVRRLPAHWPLCLVQAMDLHDDDDNDVQTKIHWKNISKSAGKSFTGECHHSMMNLFHLCQPLHEKH